MSSFTPSRFRSPLACRIVGSATGRAASAGLLFALSVLSACSDDSKAPAQPTGVVDTPDASVRELPGDGREPTPDFDIDSRQRNPIGPEQVTEGIDELQNGPRAPVRDAGAADPVGGDAEPVGDAGAVNGSN